MSDLKPDRKYAVRCLAVVMLLAISLQAQTPIATADAGTGRIFYVDPARGDMDNPGSAAAPWSTLQEVIAHGLIETHTPASHPYRGDGPLTMKNPGAPVGPGDTLVLRNGHHGELRLRGAYNLSPITIRAAEGHRPTLSRITMTSVARWRLEGLAISPEFGAETHARPLIQVASHGWHGPSSDVRITGCEARSIADSARWDRADWNARACNGIAVSGDRMVIADNRLKNVNFGITLSGNRGRVSRNRVENFAGDGMRGLGNDLIFEYNTVMNCYNVNDNHDDGFQSWSIRDDPPRERIVLRGNVIINYDDPNQPWRGPLQGIGCFDGPYVDWVVENNLIVVDHYHGISLYGAHNCRIVNNTVFDLDPGKPGPPWIGIHPHKDKTPSSNCLIRNNLTPRVIAGPGVEQDHNLLLGHGDRIFDDPEAGNFHLRPRSPAVDAGRADLAPDIDLEGRSRPQGRGIDLGAYELAPAQKP